MKFETPDRSKQLRNFTKTPENDVIDIGNAQGFLTDDRPYVAELWAQDQATFLTMFFSSVGMDDLTDEGGATLVEREGLAKLGPERGYCAVRAVLDDSGRPVWSLNLVVGDDESTYVHDDTFKFHPYVKVSS